MKTKRFNWAYIIIGIVGLLMASCAVDDEDEVGELIIPQENGVSSSEPYKPVAIPEGEFEGVWFSIGNYQEPVDTAIMTVKKNGSMSFSSVPCDSIINFFAKTLSRESGGPPTEFGKALEENFKRTAKSTIEPSASFTIVNTANSNTSLFFELTDESKTFPLRGEILDYVFDKMTIRLAPRKSIAVYDIMNKQWGVFLYYESAVLHDIIDWPFALEYKFITTKKIK